MDCSYLDFYINDNSKRNKNISVTNYLPIFPSSLSFLLIPRFRGVKMKGPELVDSPYLFNLTGSKCGRIRINLKDLYTCDKVQGLRFWTFKPALKSKRTAFCKNWNLFYLFNNKHSKHQIQEDNNIWKIFLRR